MKKEKSTFARVMEFAGQKRSGYWGSVLLALIGAAFQILPFYMVGRMLQKILSGDQDLRG